jgi:phosphohistidine swiveling domain-containing protein
VALIDKEEVLGQRLGDDKFPVKWESETEKKLFWVLDDLHCPHPLTPMFFDIGGWWASCDNMFRRFGTPFAADWIAKNVNGYLYTAAVPADPDLLVEADEFGSRYAARVPRNRDYAARIGTYLGAVLPVYGLEFATWWRERLVPEITQNYGYVEGKLDQADQMSLMQLAVLMEDTLDIYDRHWKIHWMLNFGQLSATNNLRAVMEKTHGKVDDVLLGRLQNSPQDRNWDSVGALWKMKEEVKGDPALAGAFKGETAQEILASLDGSDRGRRFMSERVKPYQKEYGWHAVWSHEVYFATVVEEAEPVIELVRGYLETDFDFPTTISSVRTDVEAASKEILQGLSGEALEEMRAANAINLLMAPLTPDHHFYLDQGTNAHVRLVLMAIGKKLVEKGALDRPDDVVMLRWYDELRVFMADQSALDARALIKQRRAEREESYEFRPPSWIGTATESQLNFPYLGLWGFPDRFYQKASTVAGEINGLAGSPGVIEGTARVVLKEQEFDEVKAGDILICQMTNPAWVVLFTKISGIVTDGGGVVSHACVLSREFGIPCVVGTNTATRDIKSGDRIRVNGSTGFVEILGTGA